uniref:Uncharacterized protein n=1 Tax=viral metagenome TaxID=1070528 RepID=A0A6M3JRL7_9ZZZZ
MTLVELRQKFVELSGRYDLVVNTTAWADNGADFFINAGQDHLDRLGLFKKSQARFWGTIAIGGYYINITRARAVQRVWVSTTTDKYPLEPREIDEIKDWYPEPPSLVDTGRPLYYAPTVLRNVPEESDQIIIDSFGGTATDTVSAEHYEYHGLFLYPPADVAYQAEVWGLFYTNKLEDDADESWWSVQHPLTLILAAMRAVEVSYRNTQGVNDMNLAIASETSGMDKDMVEEDIAQFNQISG